MKLYIDTSNHEKILVKIDDKEYKNEARRGASQTLLPLIEAALKENNLDFKDISEIMVKTNGESFTGLRVGVAVANTLGWVLKVLVNGKKPPVSPDYQN